MDGFIILNKEPNMTSFDCVAKCRGIFKTKQVGHTGTLDPMTTGVLVIALNKATKLMELTLDKKKKYYAQVLVGYQTDMLDVTGEVIEEKEVNELDLNLLKEKIKELSLTTKQIPPMYSAIKVNGKKLYEYARAGIEVKREARDIHIDYIDLKTDIYKEDNYLRFEIEILADSGIYVRSLIDDLGKLMNVPMTMSKLSRLQSGNYKIEDSSTLDDLRSNNYKLVTIEEIFKDTPYIEVNDYIAKLVKNGVMLDQRQAQFNEIFRVYHNKQLIALFKPHTDGNYKIVVYLGE